MVVGGWEEVMAAAGASEHVLWGTIGGIILC